MRKTAPISPNDEKYKNGIGLISNCSGCRSEKIRPSSEKVGRMSDFFRQIMLTNVQDYKTLFTPMAKNIISGIQIAFFESK
jgi:hypothetical protein